MLSARFKIIEGRKGLSDFQSKMAAEKSPFSFARLNNQNYSAWAFKMQMYLMKENCWDSLENEDETMNLELQKKDKRAWNLIALCVDDNQHVHIKGTKGGREAWKRLKEFHVQTSLSARIRIMKMLFRVRLEDGITMQDHLQAVFEGFHALDEIGAGLENDMAVSVMLASLNRDYEPLITALEAWDEKRLTLQAVRAKLLEEWHRKEEAKTISTRTNEFGETSSEIRSNEFGDSSAALSSVRRQRDDRTCYNCGKRGHVSRFCRKLPHENASVARAALISRVESKIIQRKQMRIKRICYECRQPGHDCKMCPEKKKLLSVIVDNRNVEIKKDSYSAKVQRWENLYLMSSSLDEISFQDWIVDSGATNHMCCDKKLFSSLRNGNLGNIVIANGDKLKATGIGNIKIVIGENNHLVELDLRDVLFVPDMKTNLLSVQKITAKGFCVKFIKRNCYLSGHFGSYLIANHNDGVYSLVKHKCHIAASQMKAECIHEWHKRLAHRNLNDVRKIKHIGLNIRKCDCQDSCEACVQGKMSRFPFPQASEKKRERLECVASDICEMPIESIGRSRYFITFTDLYSGYTHVGFMRKKSEAFEKSVEFIEYLKTQINMKPKIFRSDRGGEYLSHKFQNYLSENGIKFECTVGYAPEQNGIAERKNRTLVEAARTMLISSSLPKSFWAEAINNANQTFNRLPIGEFNKTPHEKLFNQPPKFDFHEFGCEVFVMIPTEKRRKLDSKVEKMRFLGCDTNSKGYRVVSSNRVIRVSRDVKFMNKDSAEKYVNEDNDELPSEQREPIDVQPDDPKDNSRTIIISSDESETGEDADDTTNVSPKPATVESRPYTRSMSIPLRSTTRRMRVSSSDEEQVSTAMKAELVEPKTFREAMSSTQKNEWKNAMMEEIESIENNGTWTPTDLPSNRKSVGSKWVFKLKRDENGKIVRYKARLVAQGFTQKYGVDYDEVFAPVARSTTLRIFLSFAGKLKFCVKQYDIKTAFLNGDLKEEIYLRPPQGFKFDDKVYKLNKSLYGLKQAARVWNETLHNELVKIGFVQNETDKCLYVLRERDNICYLLVHVDDMLMASNKIEVINSLALKISQKFEMTDMGNVKHYLGIDVERDQKGNFMLSQSKYISKIVETANLSDAKPSKYPIDPGYYKIEDENFLTDNSEYRKLIGMLLYLTTHSRPDIAASVSILSQKVSKPNQTDMTEVKRIIKYLKGTQSLKLRLSNDLCDQNLIAYSDANWAEDKSTRRSNSGYLCSINGGSVSWCCRRQDIIALSSTEAEYVALTETCKDVIWLKRLLKFFDLTFTEPITILTDSQSCMKMIVNDKFSNRTKHIDTKFHFTKELVSKGEIKLKYIETENNAADLFTKPLASIKMKHLRTLAGLIDITIEGKC